MVVIDRVNGVIYEEYFISMCSPSIGLKALKNIKNYQQNLLTSGHSQMTSVKNCLKSVGPIRRNLV